LFALSEVLTSLLAVETAIGMLDKEKSAGGR
jgi:hypothetical protein